MASNLIIKLDQLTYLDMGKIFKRNFVCSGELGPKFRPFLIHEPVATNQKPNILSLSIFDLLKICTDMITKCKHHLIKFKSLHCTAILSKS